MKASKSTTSNTIAVLLTIAVLVLAWKMVLPGYFSHKANLSGLETEVESAKLKLSSIEKAKAELSNIKPITDQLLVSVPKGPDEPDLISELEAIATKNSITLPAISISGGESEQASSATSTTNNSAAGATAGVGTNNASSQEPTVTADSSDTSSGTPVIISISVSGSFENLNNFISGIEKSVRFMNIVSLNYGIDTENGGNTLALQIEAFQR